MKKALVVLAIAALVAPAMAQKVYNTSTDAFTAPGSTRAIAQGTGFEAPDFAAGDINGQSGWSVFSGDTAQVVSTANPATGAQHYRNQFESAFGTGTNVGAFSPDTGPSTIEPQTMSLDVNIGATGGADYDIVPQAPSQSFLTARVKFNYLGNIFVLDDTGLGLAFEDTGVAWTPGVYKNLTIDMDPGANTMDYYYDGSLIWSSVAGVYAGTAMEQVVILSDNWHFGESGDFDNLSVTPEPASLLLLVLGALAIRRR